jgi:predicted Zn-dependent protease
MERDVVRLRRLQKEGRHAEVVRDVRSLLPEAPENRDLLLLAATSERHLRHIPEALELLDRLERTQPRLSGLHQERGLCYVGLKDAPRAVDSLLRAVNINPALPISWRMLEGVYRLTGDDQNASTAAAHVTKLKELPPAVVHATSLFADGELGPAERIIRAFLLEHGDHPDAMRLLARIALAHDALNDAETLLEAILILAPDYQAARYDYAETLIKRQKYLQAKDQVERLLALEPANSDYRTLAATAAVGLGRNDEAIDIYHSMLEDAPASWDVPLWLGHALKTVSRTAEAIASYRAAAAARPNFGDAYWSLANLKMYRFTDEEMVRMAEQEALPSTGLEDRFHLCFALGKAYEDRNQPAESWRYYERGNALKRSTSNYHPEFFETNTREQIRVCTPGFFQKRAGWGAADTDPIFILGLPRSGSTLLEQILASHSAVEGTQELSDIQRIVLDIQGHDSDPGNPRYPDALTGLTQDDVRRFGEAYLADTRVYRADKPFFIDKMPNNFRHIGLVHLMLPNAKIIDARRDPMSCCFSNLKQLFARGQEFSYGVEDIARYYRTYLDLMRHWDEALPGRVLLVQHEDVVDNLEGSVRRMLDYCGLPFEPACVDFHKTKRSVRTPSSEQVRQPIFRDGLDQWKTYAAWLEPLQAALGDALVRYRD